MKNILIAGATGRLGGLIAHNLLQNKEAKVFAIVRDAKAEKALALEAQGVKLLVADLSNKEEILQATKGIDIVISALNGGPDVMLGGQLNLLEASVKNGISRFVPSDYSVDYFKLNYGDNVNLDLRKKTFEAIEKSGIGYTIFLNGAFTEIFTNQYFNVIDFENGTVNFWGDGTEKFDITTIPDTAKYIASAVFDETTLNQIVNIAGDETTMNEVTQTLSALTGKVFKQINNGTNDELKTLIDTIKSADPSNVKAYVFHQYKRPMFNGVGKLNNPISKHYDGTEFTNFNSFISRK
jgi:nucleoside-diphosphate-sugar epimerase